MQSATRAETAALAWPWLVTKCSTIDVVAASTPGYMVAGYHTAI